MASLPHFRSDMQWRDVSAAELNDWVALSARTSREISQLRARIAALQSRRTYLPPMRVIVTQPPVDGEDRIRVQQVAFKTVPPEPCDATGCFIERIGVEMDAYPDFGKSVLDYDDFVVTESTTLDASIAYLVARHESNRWFVEIPASGGTIFVVVREVVNAGDGHVRVQDVKPVVVDGVFTGTFTAAGDDNDETKWYDMAVWPHMDAEDFEAFVWSGAITRVTTIMTAFRTFGMWWLAQLPRFDPRKAPPDIAASDCLVFA